MLANASLFGQVTLLASALINSFVVTPVTGEANDSIHHLSNFASIIPFNKPKVDHLKYNTYSKVNKYGQFKRHAVTGRHRVNHDWRKTLTAQRCPADLC
jgi:hypothetical protein